MAWNSRIASLARLVVTAELPVILVIAPALLFPTPMRLSVLAVVPVMWWCGEIAGGRMIPHTPMNAALWLILAMVGVSLYATFDIRFSLGKVSGVILGLLLFWAVARWITTSGRMRLGTAVFLIAGAGLAVVGLLGTNEFAKTPTLGVARAWLPMSIRGVPGAEEGFNPNAVAGCLVLFVPLQVAMLAGSVPRWLFPESTARWAGVGLVVTESVLLVLTASAVLLMHSRGAWAGLFVATVAFLVWHGRRTRILAGAGMAAVLVLATVLDYERLPTLLGPGAGISGTATARLEVWSRAIYGIQDFPLTGMGMNAFRKVMPVLYPTWFMPADADVAHAHNHLLQAALDLGIPGLVAYISIWLLAGALLVIVYRQSQERIYRSMAGGLGAGLIAHFMFGMTDAIPLGAKVGILFWMTLALVVSLHRIAVPRPRTLPTPSAIRCR